jgi:hypothetical protein
MWAAIQSVSPSVAIEVSPINMTDAGEIERVRLRPSRMAQTVA